MTEIFPMVQPGGAGLDATAQAAGEPDRRDLPLYRDVLWGPAKDSDNPAGVPFEASGVIVVCEPMPDSQIRVVTEIREPVRTVKLYQSGKNLLPPQQRSRTAHGVTYTVRPDQSIQVSGRADSTGSSYYLDSDMTITLDRPGWLSGVEEGSGVSLDTAYDSPLGGTFFAYDRGQGTAVPARALGQVCISVPGGRRVDTVVRPQLELGDKGTPWEPPRQSAYERDLGRTVEAGEYDWDTGRLTITAPAPEVVQLEAQEVPAAEGVNILRGTGALRVQGTEPGGKTAGEHLQAIWSADGPVMVEGAEALRGWIWRALSTVRRRWPIFTHDYGCEAESLIGRPYTSEVRESEGIRMIREALEPSPYILGVRQAKISFEGSRLTLEAQIDTVYGEVHTNVRG